MRKDRRWMTTVTKEAAKAKVAMPWARGAQRAAFAAKRVDAASQLKDLRA